jgi:superfamily II DNA or RNA helicase/HKD family nuclease
MSKLSPGLYEQLLTLSLEEDLQELGDPGGYSFGEIETDDGHIALSQFLEQICRRLLSTYRGDAAGEKRARVVKRVLSALNDEFGEEWIASSQLAVPLRRLLVVREGGEDRQFKRPDTPLSLSALLTGTRLDPSLVSQFRKELTSADRVDILCSFIRWSGLRIILEDLRELAERFRGEGAALRVITTSYMGATDPRAIEALGELPRTEVRVSYDTKRTRLHAKAYVFHRYSSFGSAYIGSANLSHAAISDGLEWTTKISQYELPHLWRKITGTFETYWEDDEFQSFSAKKPERFRKAIKSEHAGYSEVGTRAYFDFHPYPFQQEILDILSSERTVQGKNRHLIIAATGTGKTMVSAFDYARICSETGEKPSFLFIAHREEILKQALETFQAVLQNYNFGDLLVGGREPERERHLFCSIQSYNARTLWERSPDAFDYIVVDEFHHAAAPSYRRMLDHVQPKFLIGLTATPERSDDLDVFQFFGGKASAEIRLPDAINRRLLCPFQYFGVSDSVDLSGLTWQRGGYRVEDLDRVYTGNDMRARLVLRKVQEILLDPLQARGLGFCVSKAHAEFMARFFTEHGVPASSLTADSSKEDRNTVQTRLRNRQLNFIFVVDLYNEGVDIPEIDAVLFLRPTESLTIFLQQLGRGLRLHKEKECLTVLDFIGAQHREFRFAHRFRALSINPTERIDREIEHEFPHLPNGCVIQLERVAAKRVLDNVRQALKITRPTLIKCLRELGRHLGRAPTIDEALDYLDISLDALLKRGLWSRLLSEADLVNTPTDQDEKRLAIGLRRLCHADCPSLIAYWLKLLDGEAIASTEEENRSHQMLHISLWGEQGKDFQLSEADERLVRNSAVYSDLKAILKHKSAHCSDLLGTRIPEISGPLSVHAQYTRDEILVGLGHWTLSRRPGQREGVLHIPASKVDAFFVTLHKTEADYSPTTMYDDYLISQELFHWQSQSNTSTESPTGERYLRHKELGYTPILFVRESKALPSGLSAPYYYLGPCDYVSHEGSRPISIVWRLQNRVPARLYRVMARQVAA